MLNDEQKAIARSEIENYCNGEYYDVFALPHWREGVTCPAVIYVSEREAVLDMINLLTVDDAECLLEHQALSQVFRQYKIDSRKYSNKVVLYFPELKTKGVSCETI